MAPWGEGRYEMLPMRPGDVVATMTDVSELEKATYGRSTTIDTGIGNSVKWYREY